MLNCDIPVSTTATSEAKSAPPVSPQKKGDTGLVNIEAELLRQGLVLNTLNYQLLLTIPTEDGALRLLLHVAL